MDEKKLEKKLSISFHNKKLLRQAFTHSSYVNEHRNRQLYNNERLEFLGDAVLELGVSRYLYKKYPQMTEGEMTKKRAIIVCEESLYHFANILNFGQYVLLGKGEEQTGGRKRQALLADVFEAFLGALYLDQGIEAVFQFLETYVFPNVIDGVFSHAMDYKSELQELVQQDKQAKLHYKIVAEKGPSHSKEFVAEVSVNGTIIKQGIGRTKKEAEQRAARQMLTELKQQNAKS